MSVEEKECIICGRNAQVNENISDANIKRLFHCKYCGKFYEMDSLKQFLYKCNLKEYQESFDKSKLYKVSSWTREQNDEFNVNPEIDSQKFEEILNMRGKKIQEKFDLMMVYLSTLSKNETLNEKILVKCWLKNTDELDILLQKAQNHNLIEGHFSKTFGAYSYPLISNLTFDGLQYIEELEEPNKNSKKIFVAFNFDDSLTSIFNTNLKEAIESEGFEYVVVNQDNVEHNKSINDEIIVKLKTSRIVIADFTNHRNSVYFEAGFAMGMNIPIIWTCQKGHEDEMSFDTRQFPHIVWEDKDDLVKQVIDRIKRIL